MGTLQGPVTCPTVPSKQPGISLKPVNGSLSKARTFQRKSWGLNGYRGRMAMQALSLQSYVTMGKSIVRCSYSSSSNDNGGSMAENFSVNDEHYVNSSVIEAVEVKSSADGFVIKMRDGKHVRCVHNCPRRGQLPDYAPHPAIVLKIEDGSDLLLPIIVMEMPSVLLMAAVHNVQMARPTLYQIINDMIEKMGYSVQLVRVTKRVHEAYFARLYLTKVGDATETISFDLRPSDAINIAVRCKIPIQVNKHLAYSDGMKVVDPARIALQLPLSDGILFTDLDKPDSQPSVEAKEFVLVRNMLIAAVEERYIDAAQWRDQLTQFRSKKKNWA